MSTKATGSSFKTTLIILAVLIGVATLFLILSFVIQNIPTNTYETTGIVDHINYETDTSSGQNLIHVFVKYTYQGTDYINELRSFVGNLEVGQTLTVYVSTVDPTLVDAIYSGGSMNLMFFLAIVIYSVALIGGGISLFRYINNKKKAKPQQKEEAL